MSHSEKKIFIDKEMADRIKWVCQWRKGIANPRKFGPQHIADDLAEFIDGPLRKKMTRSTLKKEIGETAFLENVKLFEAYKGFQIKKSSLQNALSGTGVLRSNFIYLEKILQLYLEEYEHLCPPMVLPEQEVAGAAPKIQGLAPDSGLHAGHFFSPEIINTIKAQSGSLCTLKNCRILTEVTSRSQPDEIVGFGIAAMIYGCRPGDPRYEKDPPVNVYSAENGIWLCANHAILVNAAKGQDYTAADLYKLKEIHREFLREKAEGKKSINIMGFHPTRNEIPAVSALLNYFENQDFLFSLPATEHTGNITAGAEILMTFLSNELQTKPLTYSVFLLKQLASLQYLCKALVNKSGNVPAVADFSDVFLVFQKMVGLVFDEISVKYNLPLEGRLLLIAPQHK